MNLENEGRFQLEDISTTRSRNIAQKWPIEMGLDTELRASLSHEEMNLLLGRRQALATSGDHLLSGEWDEKDWQGFFQKEMWVFGYGLDYRIQSSFDREMTVSSDGTDIQNKAIVDFLQTFRDCTVLVEIKRPDTPIFKKSRGGRAGTWDFSPEFIGAVLQVIEQKAQWLSHAETGELFNKAGGRRPAQRTRNSKTVLVIGNRFDFQVGSCLRNKNIVRDTFELFRQEARTIDVITYDEFLERARFIVTNS